MRLIFTLALSILATTVSGQNRLTPEQLIGLNRVSAGQFSPTGEHVLYSVSKVDYKTEKTNSDLYLFSIATGVTRNLTNSPHVERNAVWISTDRIAFLSSHTGKQELFVVDTKGNIEQLSKGNFDQVNAFAFDATNKRLITLQSDKIREHLNTLYADLPNANARIESSLMYRHWAAYDDYTVEKLYAYPFDGKTIGVSQRLTLDDFPTATPPFGGLDQVALHPTTDAVVYATKKLKGTDFAQSTNSELYENVGGLDKQLTLNFGLQGYDNHPKYSKQGKLAWLNMARPGFEADKVNILLFESTEGYANLTEKFMHSVEDFVWNGDGTKIYFLATVEATKQIFLLDVKSTKITQLTIGDHDYNSLDVFGDRLVAGRNTMIQPSDLYLIDYTIAKTGKVSTKIAQITKVNPEWDKLDLPSVEKHWVKTTDGKQMLVWIVKPPKMEEGVTYPSLLYCQGGPQSAVSQFFSYRWNLCLMASEGYVVVAPNRRGLPGFGQEWNDAISGDWGGQPMRDYLSATDYAMDLPYVNKDKMGAIGASYGGYSVYMLAGLHEKRFKTFVSHCGLFNLESWYGTTEELFFANWEHGGPYWLPENKSNYEKNSPHKLVQNWDTPMLVIHGGIDFRVPESEGMQAFQAAQLKGLRSKFLYFPTEGHWVVKPQNSLIWHREFFKWLSEDLK